MITTFLYISPKDPVRGNKVSPIGAYSAVRVIGIGCAFLHML